MKRFAWFGLFAAALTISLFFAGTACDDDDDDDDNDTGAARSYATYNAGLAHGFVAYADERLPEIQQALQSLDADVLCMQEVWEDDDIAAIEAAVAGTFPNMYRYDSTQDDFSEEGAEPPCDDLDDLRGCAEDNCAGLPADELAACILSECRTEFDALPVGCQECLAAHIGQPFDDIEEACTTAGAGNVSYDGANGLLLFAKDELTAAERLQLDFFLVVRVVLYARMQTADGPVHLFCTHLTADLADPPYNGDYDSYGDEQAAQIAALLAWVDEKAGTEPAVIMGDFNTGPALDGIDAELPDNYAALVAGGLADPYTDLNPDCTWCGDNPLTGGGNSSIIDHVLFANFGDATFSAERLFDEEITIDDDGTETATRLSDHYGVLVNAE